MPNHITKKNHVLLEEIIGSVAKFERQSAQILKKEDGQINFKAWAEKLIETETNKRKAAVAFASRMRRRYCVILMSRFRKKNKKLAEAFCREFLGIEMPPTEQLELALF